jgi:hypothetical protein
MLEVFMLHCAAQWLLIRSARNSCLQHTNTRTNRGLKEYIWKLCVCDDGDWIHMAQDRDQWWAIVNKKPSDFIKKKASHFLTSRAIRSCGRTTLYAAMHCAISPDLHILTKCVIS